MCIYRENTKPYMPHAHVINVTEIQLILTNLINQLLSRSILWK